MGGHCPPPSQTTYKKVTTPIPKFLYALSTVTDDNGFIPFSIAKFASVASGVGHSFEDEYADVCALAEQAGYTLGIEAKEFSAWLASVTGCPPC